MDDKKIWDLIDSRSEYNVVYYYRLDKTNQRYTDSDKFREMYLLDWNKGVVGTLHPRQYEK